MISQEETKLLKGIAILMVVVQHIGQVFNVNIINPLGSIGVFIFLFLSGYGLSCSYMNNGRYKYFTKKIIKVYIPYAMTILIFLLCSWVLHNQLTLNNIPQFFILTKLPQGSYWYLILLFYWYILFYFLTYVFDKPKFLLLGLAMGTVLIIILEEFSRLFIWQFASFPLGVIVAKYPEQIKQITKTLKSIRGGVILIFLSVLMVIAKKLPYVESHELGVIDTLLQIGITWCLGIWVLLRRTQFLKIEVFKIVLLIFGEISYELYLSHVFLLNWLKDNANVFRISIYIFTIIISIIFLRIFENYILSKR